MYAISTIRFLAYTNFARLPVPYLIKTTCRECAGGGGAGPPRPPLPLWDGAAAGERPHNVLHRRLAEALRHLSPSCRLGKVKDQKEYRSLTVSWILIRFVPTLCLCWLDPNPFYRYFLWDKCTVSSTLSLMSSWWRIRKNTVAWQCVDPDPFCSCFVLVLFGSGSIYTFYGIYVQFRQLSPSCRLGQLKDQKE